MSTASIPTEEELRRRLRKGSYHLVASRNKLPHPDDPEDEEYDMLFQFLTASTPFLSEIAPGREGLILQAKTDLLRNLASSMGDTTTPGFEKALDQLIKLHDPKIFDARKLPPPPGKSCQNIKGGEAPQLEGMWLTLSMPKFKDCLGCNENRDLQYTLGRMSFDMFKPSRLVCSIQGIFNPVRVLDAAGIAAIKHVPKKFRDEVKAGDSVIRSYNIVTAFSIEAKNTEKFGLRSPNDIVDQPIEALMTTYGFLLPNPKLPNRLSVWFTGGSIEVDSDEKQWARVFDVKKAPKRKFKERARIFGAKVLVGATPAEKMEPDGKMTYELSRPMGSHDRFYIDVLYLDETLRIARSNTGAIYVFASVPNFPDD